MVREKKFYGDSQPIYTEEAVSTALPGYGVARDVFGNEEGHSIQYKTLSWPIVALLMIAEIVSNGMLSLPSSSGVVGLIPNIILIVFLGIWGTFTAYLLVEFKLNHPDVHNMGDAGNIMFGPIGREILAAGTVVFAIMATGGQLLAGQIALQTLSDSKLCLMVYTGIFAVATLILSFPRTFDQLGWLSIPSVLSILFAGLVGMIGAGVNPVSGRTISLFLSPSFNEAFISITNPVFAYAGHFMFFILISEMRNPKDAMKAAYALQTFATTYYTIFAIVTYVYIGNDVASPSLSSLSNIWAKVSFGIAIPNFLFAGALYAHAASKLMFLRLYRNSHHLHSHTVQGWSVWTIFILLCNAIAFILAVAVPIFSYLIGITAALFASWFTYGIAGMFWLHDSYYFAGQGVSGWFRRPVMFVLCVLTVLGGAFICVAGTYVTINAIVEAYQNGLVGSPFTC